MARSMIRVCALVLFAPAALSVAQPPTTPRENFAAGLAALVQRDFPAAQRFFRAVITADPQSHEAYNNLAVAEAEQGHEEDAAADLREAVRLRPEYERAHQNLAAIYVRLAAKELLAAAEHADGPRRQALAAAARQLLIAGPQVAPSNLLARADSLADAAPIPLPTQTEHSLPTATPTAEAAAAATPSAAPLARSVAVVLEPQGAQALVIDPVRGNASLYRRDAAGLGAAGQWPIACRGVVAPAVLLTVARRSDWSVRLFDASARQDAAWVIESATKATKSANAVVFNASDFRTATATLTPGRDVVLILRDGAAVSLDTEGAAELRERLEAWRAAWVSADLDAYAACYAADFTGDRGRPHSQWLAQRRDVLARSGALTVRVREVAVLAAGDVALTRFEQEYESRLERSRTRKQLWWRQIAGQWVITAEQVAPVAIPPAPRE